MFISCFALFIFMFCSYPLLDLKKNCDSHKNSKNSTDTTIHQYYVDEKCSN